MRSSLCGCVVLRAFLGGISYSQPVSQLKLYAAWSLVHRVQEYVKHLGEREGQVVSNKSREQKPII
jgi:hypothetical protein